MPETGGEALNHLTSAAMIVYGLQYLKRAGWMPFITEDSSRLNRWISAVAAALTAFGISATGDASTGWTIQIPSLMLLASGIWEWGTQFTMQQLIWDGFVGPKRVRVAAGGSQ